MYLRWRTSGLDMVTLLAMLGQKIVRTESHVLDEVANYLHGRLPAGMDPPAEAYRLGVSLILFA
jgi:hypothetical protein